MSRISFVDTTLRDGHQCLWATRMSTRMLEPALERMDRIGFEAIELMGAVHFDACVRYLKEDPWARIRLVRERTSTPLQALLRSRCALGFELQPADLNRLWVERLVANGIDRFVAFDGLHDLDNLVDGLLHAKAQGAMTTGWLIFSQSPVHTDELYARKAREFIDRAEVDMVMIEDTSGILTPERITTLVPAIKAAIGDRRLGLHTHNLVGLGQRAYLTAVDVGVDQLYTCIPPVADGNAPPSVSTTLRNLRYAGHEAVLDDALIAEVGAHFDEVADRYGFPKGRPQDFDAANFGHQIPGGVLSNLVSQLQAAGLGDRVDAVLDECARVREELGWPIMVTPFSQFVGVQATLNVIEGERYARVPDEVKKYALGYFGKLLAPVHADVLDRIVARGARSIAEHPPEQPPVVERLRQRHPHADGDELLLRSAFPPHVLDDRVPEPSRAPGLDIGQLVNALLRYDHLDEVRITTAEVELTLRW
ncbi:MAG: carboxylase [Gammaproteobacteria bacterium]|nr:carboxylase [Gammaproteobacteria bacterium]